MAAPAAASVHVLAPVSRRRISRPGLVTCRCQRSDRSASIPMSGDLGPSRRRDRRPGARVLRHYRQDRRPVIVAVCRWSDIPGPGAAPTGAGRPVSWRRSQRPGRTVARIYEYRAGQAVCLRRRDARRWHRPDTATSGRPGAAGSLCRRRERLRPAGRTGPRADPAPGQLLLALGVTPCRCLRRQHLPSGSSTWRPASPAAPTSSSARPCTTG